MQQMNEALYIVLYIILFVCEIKKMGGIETFNLCLDENYFNEMEELQNV